MDAFYLTKSMYEDSLRNPRLQAIRAELLEVDKEITATVNVSSLVGSQRPPQGFYPSQHWSRVFEYPWAIERLTESLGSIEGKKILDIGSGISPLPVYLARHGAEVTCIDTHPVGLPGVKSIEMDAREWHCQEKFDAITCISTVEHIPGVDLVKLFKQWMYGAAAMEAFPARRPDKLLVSIDIPLHSPYGVDPMMFASLMVWLAEWNYVGGVPCFPGFPGYEKILNSSDFGEEGKRVGLGIGIFCLEL